MGRIDAWDELSLFGIWDELSFGTNCRLGRIVVWDELSFGTNCRFTGILGVVTLSTLTVFKEAEGYQVEAHQSFRLPN